jgi:hypothetical protein
MIRILMALSTLIVVSCNDQENKKADFVKPEQMIGEWNNLSIRVDIETKKNTDSSEVLNVEQAEWEQRLKIKPIRTYFRADSTWNSAHYNLNDSLVYNPSGKWWIENDSLIMVQTFPSVDTSSYLLKLNKDTASFTSRLDWDMDGKKDDLYVGRQLKVNRP